MILAVLRSSGRRPRAVEDGTTKLLGLAGVAAGCVETGSVPRNSIGRLPGNRVYLPAFIFALPAVG